MAEPIVYNVTDDLVDRLIGLTPGNKTYEVRHQREKVAAATQGSYDALFDPALPGLSLTERLLVALQRQPDQGRVIPLHGHTRNPGPRQTETRNKPIPSQFHSIAVHTPMLRSKTPSVRKITTS